MRIIAHLDMDAFFASVEERERPRLKGLPIVVGADPKGGLGRGVVSTANYKARAYGIRSALPISKAWQFSEAARHKGLPPAVFLGGNFRLYEQISRSILEIVSKYTPAVRPSSIDEMYFDLSAAVSYQKAARICRQVKAEIKKTERLTCSIGLGPNLLIAKIASDRDKPDGLTSVPPDKVRSFLDPLPIRVIPGIGPKAELILTRRGIGTVRDLRLRSRAELGALLGKWGEEVYVKAYGIDASIIEEENVIRSIGKQITFPRDVSDVSVLTRTLRAMVADIFSEFKTAHFQAVRTLVLTVRFGDFKTVSVRKTFTETGADVKFIEFEALKLLMPFLDSRKNPYTKQFRLIGLRFEKLS